MASMRGVGVFVLISLYTRVLSQKEDGFVKASNCFSIDLMRKLKTPDGNLIMSGYSLANVMNMLATGARGTTADELNQALRNTENGLTGEDVRKNSRSTLRRLTSNQDVTLDVANAIYVDQSYPLNQNYKKTVEEAFLAKAENADFTSKAHEATEAINSWVDKKTRSLIKKLFDKDLPASTVLVLLNAVYFKGDWLYKFDAADTKTQPFYSGGNKSAKKMVPMMNQQRMFAYFDNKNMKAQVLKMDYKGEKISFVVALPYEGVKMEDFEKEMSCSTISGLLDVSEESLVNVFLPKLDMSSDLKLVQPLKDLGVNKIFGGGDLSGIGSGALQVSDVVQKAKIKVHEEGSEAAAVSGVVAGRGFAVKPSKVVQFLVNRPYYYFIVDKSSGLIIFQGKVNTL